MKNVTIILSVILLAISQKGEPQGFLNLNFESANIPNGTSPGTYISMSEGLPDWSAYFTSATETNQASQVAYDGVSTGGNVISIIDSDALAVSPIQGNYSVCLFGGGDGPLYSSTISQTALVPTGTESILFDAIESGAPFIVSLGGETINTTPLQTLSGYTLYGGNIPSSLAGEVETLTFTEPPAVSGAQPSFFELDNIQFLTSPVPEPNDLGLFALGYSIIALRRWRK